MKRLSMVQHVHNETVSGSSVFQIGDSEEILARSKVLAVQRQYELFLGKEGELHYPIFTRPIPRFPIHNTPVQINKLNESPVISVQNVRLLSLSTSAVFHIGSTLTVDSEARVKHIRHLSSDSESDSAPGNSQSPTKQQRVCKYAFRSRSD